MSLKLNQFKNEVSLYLYKEANVHDASALMTPAQMADMLAGFAVILSEKFGMECTIQRYDSLPKLAKKLGVSEYVMKKALEAYKVEGRCKAGTSRVTYPIDKAREAVEAYFYQKPRPYATPR